MDALRQSLNEASDTDLIDHLGELPRARWTHETAGARVGADGGLHLRVCSGVTAAHHGQDSIFCSRLAARDRRVNEPKSAVVRSLRQLPGNLRGGGGVIDEDRSPLHTRERTLV